jgi:hypothetical protein
MAHDLIHIAILHSSDSPTKAAFLISDIGVAQVTLGLGVVVSKLLNDCLEAQLRKFTIKLSRHHQCAGNPIADEWSAKLTLPRLCKLSA